MASSQQGNRIQRWWRGADGARSAWIIDGGLWQKRTAATKLGRWAPSCVGKDSTRPI